MEKMIVLGSKCPNLGRELSKRHETVRAEVKRFPDNELYVRIPEKVDGQDMIYMQSFYSNQNDSLIEAFITIDALFDLGAKTVELFAPYFPYSRQDKRYSSGEAVSALSVIKIFKGLGVKKIISVNAHQFKKEGMYDASGLKFVNLNAAPLVIDFVKSNYRDGILVVLPDAGSRNLTDSGNVVFFDKKRDDIFSGKANVSLNRGADIKGKTVLLLDDMISGGGTMLETYKKVLGMGAKEIIVSCIHGLFVGDCIKKFRGNGVKNIISTDTIDNPFSKVSILPIVEKHVL